MMSKNSFWGNMRENLKRRNWIAVINIIVFVLTFPVGITLWLTAENAYKDTVPLAEWRESMINRLADYLSINMGMTLLITILAIVCALQGFAYLFRRQKMDMYMSVPVSKRRRFFVIYLNGILLYAIPYLACLLISFIIGAVNGILTLEIVKITLYTFLGYLVYYLAVYNLMIVAVMLTGNLLVSLCAVSVFIFYESAIKALIGGLCSMFYKTFSYYSVDLTVFSSPVIQMFDGVSSIGRYGSAISVPYLIEKTGMTFAKILVLAIIFGILGYVLCAIRPAESCNKAIAFRKTRPVIKICLMVPISIVAGVLFHSITNGNMAMTIFGFIIGIVLSHSIMEIIFDFDLKAAIRHLKSAAVGAALVFGFFAMFYFDMTGYDRWVPNPEKVESIALSVPALNQSTGYDVVTGSWMGSEDYTLEQMELTDTVGICTMMEEVLDEEIGENGEEKLLWVSVKYRMKNGEDKYRQVRIPYEKYMDELNAIVADEEFKEKSYQIFDEEFLQNMKLSEVFLSNGVWSEEVDEEEIAQVFEAYTEDFKSYTFSMAANEMPIGTIWIEFERKNKTSSYGGDASFEMPVYASFENTRAYAEQYGVAEDWRDVLDNVSVITIESWDEHSYEWSEENYTDKADIEALIPALIPNGLLNYKIYVAEDTYNYDAYVDYNWEIGENGQEIEKDYSTYFQVDSSLLPDFAK